MTDVYYKPSAQCNQCYKSIFSEKQQVQKQRQNKLAKLNHLFKLLLKPSCLRTRKSSLEIQPHCSCITVDNVTISKSSESITFIDLPWIVPSKFHKNTNGPENQWIFRTGWTPQPDASALLNNGWCSHCGSCVKSDTCPSCDVRQNK